jgi:hypothetical protein
MVHRPEIMRKQIQDLIVAPAHNDAAMEWLANIESETEAGKDAFENTIRAEVPGFNRRWSGTLPEITIPPTIL